MVELCNSSICHCDFTCLNTHSSHTDSFLPRFLYHPHPLNLLQPNYLDTLQLLYHPPMTKKLPTTLLLTQPNFRIKGGYIDEITRKERGREKLVEEILQMYYLTKKQEITHREEV